MSNNPFFVDIKNHIENIGDSGKLKEICENLQVSESCPCVGKSSLPGSNVRLTSTLPGYPDYNGVPCINKITGEQLITTPEYKECLLASTCQYFFPETKKKFDDMCRNPRECSIPSYIGFGSQSDSAPLSSKW